MRILQLEDNEPEHASEQLTFFRWTIAFAMTDGKDCDPGIQGPNPEIHSRIIQIAPGKAKML